MCLKCVAITLKEDSYGQENLSQKTITTEKKSWFSIFDLAYKVNSLTKIPFSCGIAIFLKYVFLSTFNAFCKFQTYFFLQWTFNFSARMQGKQWSIWEKLSKSI